MSNIVGYRLELDINENKTILIRENDDSETPYFIQVFDGNKFYKLGYVFNWMHNTTYGHDSYGNEWHIIDCRKSSPT